MEAYCYGSTKNFDHSNDRQESVYNIGHQFPLLSLRSGKVMYPPANLQGTSSALL